MKHIDSHLSSVEMRSKIDEINPVFRAQHGKIEVVIVFCNVIICMIF